MDINTANVTIAARDVLCGDALALQHVKVESQAVRLTVPFGSGPCGAEVTLALTVTEPEVNRVLSRLAESGLRDLQVALMNGTMRITGRYEVVGPIAVPFALVATPEIEGGARIRLRVRDVSIVGAALPGFSTQVIGERVNAKLVETLNVERLGLPFHLASITVETGRLNVTATAAVEWRPQEGGIVRSRD
jgi:hypothetical protein